MLLKVAMVASRKEEPQKRDYFQSQGGKDELQQIFHDWKRTTNTFVLSGRKETKGEFPSEKKVTPLLFLHRHEKPLDFSTPSRVSIANKKGLSKNITKTDISKVYKETDNMKDITIHKTKAYCRKKLQNLLKKEWIFFQN